MNTPRHTSPIPQDSRNGFFKTPLAAIYVVALLQPGFAGAQTPNPLNAMLFTNGSNSATPAETPEDKKRKDELIKKVVPKSLHDFLNIYGAANKEITEDKKNEIRAFIEYIKREHSIDILNRRLGRGGLANYTVGGWLNDKNMDAMAVHIIINIILDELSRLSKVTK